MSVFATFLAISIVAVLFLFQFLGALISETKAERSFAARFEPASAVFNHSKTQLRDSAPEPTAAHFAPSRQVVDSRASLSYPLFARVQNSRFHDQDFRAFRNYLGTF